MNIHCPKCNKISRDIYECEFCGIYFKKYNELKSRRDKEITDTITALDFTKAKTLCEKALSYYPEDQERYYALLTEILSDEFIFQQYTLAHKQKASKDYKTALTTLSGLNASSPGLAIKTVKLRAKISKKLASISLLKEAKEDIKNSRYKEALYKLSNIKDSEFRQEVALHTQDLNDIKNRLACHAVSLTRKSNFKQAEEQFQFLKENFTHLPPDAEQCANFITERKNIVNNIQTAADKARDEGRLIDAKILYFFLGMQFPEMLSFAQNNISAIGSGALISLADLHTNGLVDFVAVGYDITGNGLFDISAVAVDMNGDGIVDMAGCDIDGDGVADVIETDTSGAVDLLSTLFG